MAISNKIVLEKLDKIILMQQQHSLIMNDLVTMQQASMPLDAKFVKPCNAPDFPIKSMEQVEVLEEFLKDDASYDYLKNRLVCVSGGGSVRSVTNAALRFLLDNGVAMNYNWAGREGKFSFKSTNMKKVICGAIELAFKNRKPSDLHDGSIENAIKDWLKQSKRRHEYQANRTTI